MCVDDSAIFSISDEKKCQWLIENNDSLKSILGREREEVQQLKRSS